MATTSFYHRSKSLNQNAKLENAASSRYLGNEGKEYDRVYQDLYGPQSDATLKAVEPFIRDSDHLLDFGCADGSLLMRLDNDLKMGVEINATSRERAISRGLVIHDSLARVSDESIDVVVSSHVLEHTLDPLGELTAINRVLRSGGRLILVLPVDDWRSQENWILPETNHHLFTWTPQLLANLLDEAGYEPEGISIWTYTLPGRFTNQLKKRLPDPLFDMLARLTAIVRKRRQIVAVATRP